jgi:hypothetical protein
MEHPLRAEVWMMIPFEFGLHNLPFCWKSFVLNEFTNSAFRTDICYVLEHRQHLVQGMNRVVDRDRMVD